MPCAPRSLDTLMESVGEIKPIRLTHPAAPAYGRDWHELGKFGDAAIQSAARGSTDTPSQ